MNTKERYFHAKTYWRAWVDYFDNTGSLKKYACVAISRMVIPE